MELRRWWGQAWGEVFEQAGPSGTRAIQRGQALARRGAVEDLDIAAGRITARVREERGSLERVELRWPLPDEGAWERVVDRLAGELRFTAALLEGSLPDGLDEVFAEVDVPIIPRLNDLELTCSCEERGRLCRHLAALHSASGQQIDRDPFLLVRLRGWSRDELLRELRARRGLRDADAGTSGIDLSAGMFAARGELDAIALHPMPVDDPAALFRHLGPPPGVDDEGPIEALIELAAGAAWRLAAGDGAEAADEEVLLAELRAQRVATPSSLGAALDRDPESVRVELDRLFNDGIVMRTGSGDRARYRAAATAL